MGSHDHLSQFKKNVMTKDRYVMGDVTSGIIIIIKKKTDNRK